MRTRVAHALRFANTSCTRRTELSVNPQFTTYKPRNSVQTTGATAKNANNPPETNIQMALEQLKLKWPKSKDDLSKVKIS